MVLPLRRIGSSLPTKRMTKTRTREALIRKALSSCSPYAAVKLLLTMPNSLSGKMICKGG